MNNYADVFFESARVASILPFSSEPTYFAMFYFGGFNMLLATVLAVAGATTGLTTSWLIGKGFFSLHNKRKLNVNEYWYNKCSVLFNKYGAILLLFSWLPLIKLLLVPAGFLNVRYRFILPLIVIGNSVAYGYYLFRH